MTWPDGPYVADAAQPIARDGATPDSIVEGVRNYLRWVKMTGTYAEEETLPRFHEHLVNLERAARLDSLEQKILTADAFDAIDVLNDLKEAVLAHQA